MSARVRFTAATIAAFASGPASPPQPALPLREAWKVDGSESPFLAPRALVVTARCDVVIADASSGVFRMPCAGGTPARVTAVGDAPGALAQPWLLAALPGDSVAVYDRALSSVIATDRTGALGSGRALPRPTIASEITTFAYAGNVRVFSTSYPNAVDPTSLQSYVLACNARGACADTLATFDGIPAVYWGSGFAGTRIPLPHPRRAVVVFIADGGFVTGYTAADRLIVHDARGNVVRTLTLGLAAAAPLTKPDRDAYMDSVRVATRVELDSLHYNSADRDLYRRQIDTYLNEDVAFPATRQRYDRLVLDADTKRVWVQLPGADKTYARTWEIHSLADGALERRVTVPHKGAVVDAVARDGALYVIERALGGKPRVVKYAP